MLRQLAFLAVVADQDRMFVGGPDGDIDQPSEIGQEAERTNKAEVDVEDVGATALIVAALEGVLAALLAT